MSNAADHNLPTAIGALQAFAAGALRPSDLLERMLARIDAQEPALHAFVRVDVDGARRAAAAADAAWQRGDAGPLGGLPVTIKDIFDIAGAVTGCGSARPPGGPSAADAAAVRRLRDAGAVILGKVQMHEFAFGITGENVRLGTPRNPYNPERLPGGSSSGSAVSVAAGMAFASLGTDTGGSVRVPSALCGLVGWKPSFGRISRRGVFPLAWSMDHVGVLTRCVSDAELFDAVLAGPDPVDPATQEIPPSAPERPIRRVALFDDLYAAAHPDLRSRVDGILGALADRGVQTERVALPYAGEMSAAYTTLLMAEAATVHYQEFRRDPTAFSEEMRTMLTAGSTLFATDYIQARRLRSAFAASTASLLTRVDALLSPTTLGPAPPIGAAVVEIDGRSVTTRDLLVTCTSPFSMVGLPAVSVPAGRVDGLPVGIQIVGSAHDDRNTLAAARVIEDVVATLPS